MALVINSSSADPYKKSQEYQRKGSQKDVEYEGIIYRKKIIYEKKLNIAYRITFVVLALLSVLTIIPCYLNCEKIALRWRQAITGVDQKIVLISKRVRFKEQRCRVFDKDKPADDVQNRISNRTEVKDKTRENPHFISKLVRQVFPRQETIEV